MKRFLFVLPALLLIFPVASLWADDHDSAPFGGGRIAYHYTGRATVDFLTGTGTVYGYFTQFGDLPTASLFRGQPGESTALLTFRADFTFQPLPGNGESGPNSFAVFPITVNPGLFRLYFHPNPARRWSDVSTFTTGTHIATFSRSAEQFVQVGPVALNTASATLSYSIPFPLNGSDQNLRRILPNGVTNITMANGTPLTGSTPVAPAFAFTGYGLAIGR